MLQQDTNGTGRHKAGGCSCQAHLSRGATGGRGALSAEDRTVDLSDAAARHRVGVDAIEHVFEAQTKGLLHCALGVLEAVVWGLMMVKGGEFWSVKGQVRCRGDQTCHPDAV